MRKNTAVLLCAVMAACLAAGCQNGAQRSEGSTGKTAQSEQSADLSGLRDKMLAAAELPEMLSVTDKSSRPERKLATITDIDYQKTDGFFIDYAADGTAYEIAVIALKSADDMPSLEKSLRSHIQKRTEQYRYYAPGQVTRAESAKVVSDGKRAALIMCDDVKAVEKAFLG